MTIYSAHSHAHLCMFVCVCVCLRHSLLFQIHIQINTSHSCVMVQLIGYRECEHVVCLLTVFLLAVQCGQMWDADVGCCCGVLLFTLTSCLLGPRVPSFFLHAGGERGSRGLSDSWAEATIQTFPLPLRELRRSVRTGPLAWQEGCLRPGGVYLWK